MGETMSLFRPLSEKQIRANFDEALKNAVDLGLWPPSDQGFGNSVDTALRQLAKSYPNIKGDLIVSARLALTEQFDGTEAARQEAEVVAMISSKRASRRG